MGAGGDIELPLERTDEGFYELRVGSELAGVGGAEVSKQRNVQAEVGIGYTQVFRFHSAPGLARGIAGLLFALQAPDFTPGNALAESGLLGDPAVHVQHLREAIAFAEARAAEAEGFLRGLWRDGVWDAGQERQQAEAGLGRSGGTETRDRTEFTGQGRRAGRRPARRP